MDDAYYLLVNGAQAGPYALSQLQSMWRLGQITADTFYWQDGFEEWQSISHIKELLDLEKPRVTPPAFSIQPTTPVQPPVPQSHFPVQKKSGGVGRTLGIGCLSLVAIFVVLSVIGSMVTGSTHPAPASTADSPDAKPDLDVESFEWSHGDDDSDLRYLKGVVVNNTDNTYSYVQVEFNLYDKDGNQVGSTFTNVNNLEPHGKWKFQALVSEDNATKARLKGVNGH